MELACGNGERGYLFEMWCHRHLYGNRGTANILYLMRSIFTKRIKRKCQVDLELRKLIDFRAEDLLTRVLVEFKYSSCQNIGSDAVARVHQVKKWLDYDRAEIVTNAYFTREAQRLAEKYRIRLVDTDFIERKAGKGSLEKLLARLTLADYPHQVVRNKYCL